MADLIFTPMWIMILIGAAALNLLVAVSIIQIPKLLKDLIATLETIADHLKRVADADRR